MPKKYFVVQQITKAEYLKRAKEAGKPEEPNILKITDSGYMSIDNKTYLAYTKEEMLEVGLEKN